ncbi:hypothetical protein [Komagataeibacter medellinensis]|uniref:hypothetical protein n=1 Tax=Komagataeibacter medellinensis TaxID=1177712 RepID=UPI00129565BB|nr:hypothetical protein [Komagataeibacter medellinensis]
MDDAKGAVRANMEAFCNGCAISFRYGSPVWFLFMLANIGARFGFDAAFCAFGAACWAVVGCALWLNWLVGIENG